ncbi:MAG: hypothetical protein IT422_04870 [Pirellulaceae bacterium]|nr:hypothetical protein [Pirellulaceae bacterium]
MNRIVFLAVFCFTATALYAQDATKLEIVDRLWVDATGSHMVRAKLLDVVDGKARLQRSDNQQIVEMSVDKLSLDDRIYCIKLYEAIQEKLEQVKKNDIDPTAVTANLSVETLDLLDQANRDLSKEMVAIESRNPTTLQRNKEFIEASKKFAKTITGRRLQVHFLLDDVRPTQFVSLERRKIELTLSAPDVQLSFSPNTIEVWIDSEYAEKLHRGDVLKMQGHVNETSRKSFGVIEFQLEPINVPDVVLGSYVEQFRNSLITKDFTIRVPFYIDTLRKLNDTDTQAFLAAQGGTQLPANRIAP